MPAVPRISYRHNMRAGMVTLRRSTVLTLAHSAQIAALFDERLGATDVMLRRVVGERCAMQVVRLLDDTYTVHVARWSPLRLAWIWSTRFQARTSLTLRGAYQYVNTIFAHYERLAPRPTGPSPTPSPIVPRPQGRRCSACGTAIAEPATQCATCIEAGRADNGEL